MGLLFVGGVAILSGERPQGELPGHSRQPGAVRGPLPLWRLSYAIIPYIRMKFEQNGLSFQSLYNMPPGMEVPWLTYQQFSNLVGNVTDMVIAEQNWQPVIDTMWEIKAVEDYDSRESFAKTDFLRKWHHDRSGKAVSLEELVENGGEFSEVADPRAEFEKSVLSQAQIDAFAAEHISGTDREILKLRMEGHTEQEIADRVGYKTASAVHKRIAKIAGAYEDFVLSEYQQYLDRHDSK